MENNSEIVIDVIAGIQEFRERKGSIVESHLLKIVDKITPLISETIKPKDIINSVNGLFGNKSRIAQILGQCKGKARIVVSLLTGAYKQTTELFTSLTASAQPLLLENTPKKLT